MEIIVPGKPIAKKRPRFVQKTGRVYNCQETEEGRFLLLAMGQMNNKFEKDIPLIVSFLFVFDRPKSHFGTGRNANKLKGSSPLHHVCKPDLSNLIKMPEDILNNILWHDDSQIIKISSVEKRYAYPGEEAHTFMEVLEL